ncbi:MAG TPA: PAS domain-containing protein, partial [Gemmatimonadaceae bacterium]
MFPRNLQHGILSTAAEGGGTMNGEPLTSELIGPTLEQQPSQRTSVQYEEMVAGIDGIIWEADAKTFQFTFVSQYAERLLGYRLEGWLARDFWVTHVHPDDRAAAVELYRRVSRDRRAENFEYRMIAAGGKSVWLRGVV